MADLKNIKTKRIKLGGIKQFFKKLPRALAEKAFLTFLGLLLISAVLSATIFYQYYISIQGTPEITDEEYILKFDDKVYQNILNEWKEKNEKISQLDRKEYLNPFGSEVEVVD